MKTLKCLALGALGLIFFASCDATGLQGEGNIVKETRTPGDFRKLNIDVPGQIELYYANTRLVEIEVEESLLPYLETEVENGRLNVFFSRNVYDVDDLRIRIYAPANVIEEIDFDGSGNLVAYDSLTFDQLRVDHDGSGEMFIRKAFSSHLGVTLSGSGRINVSGASEEITVSLSGSGEINTLELDADFADISLSGSGTIKCLVNTAMTVNLSGSGNVWYEGNPQTDITISGSGKVRRL
jgi:hypothetical protein